MDKFGYFARLPNNICIPKIVNIYLKLNVSDII